jgi:biotin carboxyl carrier protein
VKKTNRLVTAARKAGPDGRRRRDRGGKVVEHAFDYLDAPPLRVAQKDVPLPYAANLEKLSLPTVEDIVEAAKKVCYRERNNGHSNITMPALSPTMEEGNLAKWHVKVGDKVKPGDIIAEIETDKATMEVEAVDEGTVTKLLVEEGAQGVKVNAVIAELDGEGGARRPQIEGLAPGKETGGAAGR